MTPNSMWKRHANDPNWYSKYIEFDNAADIALFTQTTLGGSPSVSIVNGNLAIVNSAAAGDGVQLQWPTSEFQARGPTVPTASRPSSYQNEMEFIINVAGGNVGNGLAMGLFAQSANIFASTDCMGVISAIGSSLLGLDWKVSGSDATLSLPTGSPSNPFYTEDTAAHEYTICVNPRSGDGKLGQVRVYIDGSQLYSSGDDGYNWIAMTQQLLAGAFGVVNASAGLTAAQRTTTVARVGFAYRL